MWNGRGRNVELRLTFCLWRNLILVWRCICVYIYIYSSTLFLYFSDYCFYGYSFQGTCCKFFRIDNMERECKMSSVCKWPFVCKEILSWTWLLVQILSLSLSFSWILSLMFISSWNLLQVSSSRYERKMKNIEFYPTLSLNYEKLHLGSEISVFSVRTWSLNNDLFQAAFHQIKRIRGGVYFKNLGQSSSDRSRITETFFSFDKCIVYPAL